MKERNPARCIYHAYSATSVTFVSQVEIETLNYIFLVFYPCVIYKNVDIVFIEIYRIYPLSILKVIFLTSKETFISFNKKTMAPLERGCNQTLSVCAMGNVDRTFCLKLLSTKQTFDLYFLISVT